MNVLEQIFSDEIVIQNVSTMISAFFIAFVIAFLVTPIVARFALKFQAVDVAVSSLTGRESNFKSRMNEGTKPRLGGLAQVIGIIGAAMIFSTSIEQVSAGIWYGLIILVGVGILDDKYGISGRLQLIGQFAAALCVIAAGVAIPNAISFLGTEINLNLWSTVIEFGKISYEFIFPGHILTVIWIVGVINAINWVGGVDGLNISISSIIGMTLLFFALSQSAIPVAIMISIFLGGNLGLLPYNYNPSKIIPGTVSEYANGYLLSVFALLGPTGWTATFIIFALPIIDALIVIILRMREHPEVLRKPIKILSINDSNHFHHRLLAAGYTRKAVFYIEASLVSIVCAIALFLGIDIGDGDLSDQVIVAFGLASTVILTTFTLTYVLMQRAKRRSQLTAIAKAQDGRPKEAVVKVITDSDQKEEDYERFYY